MPYGNAKTTLRILGAKTGQRTSAIHSLVNSEALNEEQTTDPGQKNKKAITGFQNISGTKKVTKSFPTMIYKSSFSKEEFDELPFYSFDGEIVVVDTKEKDA
jgi:hypothetical protein